MATLDSTMQALDIGDAQLGAECKPPIHRTLIWAYRKLKKTPRADTAQAIIAALRKRGVEMSLDELLAAPGRHRKSA